MAKYLATSPYFNTTKGINQLNVLAKRNVPSSNNDRVYTIAKEYEHRPDLLAYDLYGDVNLWWVFTNRNPDVIKDPIFDFLSGTTIYLPQQNLLKESLGI